MHSLRTRIPTFIQIAILIMASAGHAASQQPGTLRGQVTDQNGDLIAGAAVSLTDSSGKESILETDQRGSYQFKSLVPGTYTLRITAAGFAPEEKPGLVVPGDRVAVYDAKLKVAIEKQKVTVTAESSLNTDPDNNKGALVLKGKDLDALPDDPDELQATLQALAGPAAGPSGGQLYIDGFTASQRLPSKQSIREIFINQNPFSAEHDKIGFGRIEIFTKPGTDHIHGGGIFLFNDASFDSRNPFVENRPPNQIRLYSLTASGPVVSNRASIFASFQRKELNDNAIIHSTVLDAGLNEVSFDTAVVARKRYTDLSPRFDLLINKTNTLSLRYTYSRSDLQNEGVGGFTLPSQAYTLNSSQQVFQGVETAVLNPKTVNEVRFQFARDRRGQAAENSSPAVSVLDAFNGGGSPVGVARYSSERWELQDNFTTLRGRHTFKFGGRLRGVQLTDLSPANFAGTYIFAGGAAPALDANNNVIQGPGGAPVLVQISSIERYRRTLLFRQLGLNPAEIAALGGGASQFTIAAGNPSAGIRQIDFGGYAQDDWRLRSNFTLSFGLRYENQTNISSSFNFAPRVAFAWTPSKAAGQPRTVIRGGAGIFYDRFSEALTLQARRFDGSNEIQFVATEPQILGLFPVAPSLGLLESLNAATRARWQVAPNLTAPYSIQSSISIERQLPHNLVLSAAYLNTRGLHNLVARNINAPFNGTVEPLASPFVVPPSGGPSPTNRPGVPLSGGRVLLNMLRPGSLFTAGDIYQYESSGVFNQNQLIVTASNRLNKTFTLFAVYALNRAYSNTDGAASFPSNQYDLAAEYGRAAYDIRHRFFAGGTINGRWGITLNPFVTVLSGAPFNITTGIDNNGDSLFTDRPAFATNAASPSVRITPYGTFDLLPAAGEKIIPRNFGTGPGYFTVNLRVGRTFSLGGAQKTSGAQGNRGPARPPAARSAAPGAAREAKPYKLTIAIYGSNIFNRTNAAQPVGNLSSPLFGQSIAIQTFGAGAGSGAAAVNRSISLLAQFSF
jgi:hypothetical protein